MVTMAALATGSAEGAFKVEVMGGPGELGDVPHAVRYPMPPPSGIAVTLSESAPPSARAPEGILQGELAKEKLRCCPLPSEGAPNGVPLLIRVSTTRQGVIGT